MEDKQCKSTSAGLTSKIRAEFEGCTKNENTKGQRLTGLLRAAISVLGSARLGTNGPVAVD